MKKQQCLCMVGFCLIAMASRVVCAATYTIVPGGITFVSAVSSGQATGSVTARYADGQGGPPPPVSDSYNTGVVTGTTSVSAGDSTSVSTGDSTASVDSLASATDTTGGLTGAAQYDNYATDLADATATVNGNTATATITSTYEVDDATLGGGESLVLYGNIFVEMLNDNTGVGFTGCSITGPGGLTVSLTDANGQGLVATIPDVLNSTTYTYNDGTSLGIFIGFSVEVDPEEEVNFAGTGGVGTVQAYNSDNSANAECSWSIAFAVKKVSL